MHIPSAPGSYLPEIGPVETDDEAAQIAWYLAAGYRVLTEDEVIDHGDYVTPKELLGGHDYVLHIAARHYARKYRINEVFVMSNILSNYDNKRVMCLSEKPMRIVGMFKGTDQYGDVKILRASLGSADDAGVPMQNRMLWSPGDYRFSANGSNGAAAVRIPDNYVRIGLCDLPKSDRRHIADRIITTKEYKNVLCANVVSAIRRNRQVMAEWGTVRRFAPVVVTLGVAMRADMRRTVKEGFCKPIGAILAAHINDNIGDETEFITLLQYYFSMGRLSYDTRNKLVGLWNNHAGAYEQLSIGHCGHIFREDDGHTTADGVVCESCFDDNYVHVEDRDAYWHRENAYFHEGDGLYYSYSEDSDEDEDEDEDDGELNSWSSSTEYMDHDRSFVPSHHGDFTMGIELEVESTDRKRSEKVVACREYFNAERLYAMFKADGSLDSQRGFEIVTAARRMTDHIRMFKGWKPEGLCSWDAGNCGMHVHIDSRAFTALTLGKFLMFFNAPANLDFIAQIAGRHPRKDSQAATYAAAIDAYHTGDPGTVKKSRDDNYSRYRMVNVTNITYDEQTRLGIKVERNSKGTYSTVEVRIFRGTLRKDRLLAQIEFAHAAVAFCRSASWQELDPEAFKFWLSKTAGYPNLRKWYGVFPARNKNLTEAAGEASLSCEI